MTFWSFIHCSIFKLTRSEVELQWVKHSTADTKIKGLNAAPAWHCAKTFSITTLTITTLSLTGLFATRCINDTQHTQTLETLIYKCH